MKLETTARLLASILVLGLPFTALRAVALDCAPSLEDLPGAAGCCGDACTCGADAACICARPDVPDPPASAPNVLPVASGRERSQPAPLFLHPAGIAVPASDGQSPATCTTRLRIPARTASILDLTCILLL